MKKKAFENFYNHFTVGNQTNTDDLHTYLKKYYIDLNESSLRWRIYDLQKEGYIKLIERNIYDVIDKNRYKEFIIEIDDDLIDILSEYNKPSLRIKQRFPDENNVNISVWDTKLLNKYTTHQVYKTFYIIEVDKMKMEHLFYYIKSNSNKRVLLKNTTDTDLLLDNDVIYISNLPKKSPIKKKKSAKNNYVSNPKVEKILVDVIIYNKTILPYDLSEIENIYRNIYRLHNVKTKTVLNYAKIRGPRTYEQAKRILTRIGEIGND